MKAHLMIGGAFGLLLFGHSCVRRAEVEVTASIENLARLSVSKRSQPPAVEREILLLDSSAHTESPTPLGRDANAKASAPIAVAQVNQESFSYVDARNAADLLEEDLLACFPFTGAQAFAVDWELSEGQRMLLDQWKAWRLRSIADLPEDLRFESFHRNSIHDYFTWAIHGFLCPEAATSIARMEESAPAAERKPQGETGIAGLRFTSVMLVGRTEQTATITYFVIP